jgi:DNA-binding MarR family transcriptional regulator
MKTPGPDECPDECPGEPPDDLDGLEGAKRASFAQLLFRAARRVNELAIRRARRQPGAEGLRAAHTLVFPHLATEGTRLTDLARKMGISKQAVAQLVDELEAMGAVERVPDPEDGRAKRIRFRRDRRAHAVLSGLAVLATIEAELAAQLGPPTITALHRALLALDGALDRLESPPEPPRVSRRSGRSGAAP